MVAYLKKPEGSEGFHQIETVTTKTLDNVEIELTATIDGKVKIVIEASIRRHLQLADSDGISSLPTTKIFEQISFMGRTNRQESVVPQPRSPTETPIADEAASIGVDVRYGGATTTVTSMTLQELMVLCTTLSKKVESLETDLKQTKLTYGASYTKLIKKVKKLENKVKSSQARRRAKIIIFDDEDDLEDPSKQGRKIAEIDQDPAISLDVSTAEKDVSTTKPVSTAGGTVTTASVAVSTAKDKGKAKMDEYESETAQTKTNLQQEQERLSYEAAVRLQAELKEEERQRIARVHEAAGSFNVKEWEDIQVRVEADEELAHRLQAEEKEMYTKAEQARMLVELINHRKRYFATQRAKKRRNKPPTQAQQRTYMSNYIKHIGGYTLQQLRGYSFDEIKNLFETTMRRVRTFVLIDSEIERVIPELAAGSSKRDVEEELDQESSKRQKTGKSSKLAKEPRDKEDDELSQEELQKMMIIVPEQGMNVEALQTKDDLVELKRLFEPDIDDKLWKLQKHIHDLNWKLYDSCEVHRVSTEKGIDIYMLVEKEYPLSRGTLTHILVVKLLVEQDNEMSRELLRKIFMNVERPRR
ncbi:hypothetical protein Tco_0700902 [Tanacetum coccineum]